MNSILVFAIKRSNKKCIKNIIENVEKEFWERRKKCISILLYIQTIDRVRKYQLFILDKIDKDKFIVYTRILHLLIRSNEIDVLYVYIYVSFIRKMCLTSFKYFFENYLKYCSSLHQYLYWYYILSRRIINQFIRPKFKRNMILTNDFI